MRKTIETAVMEQEPLVMQSWLDLEKIARVELTSEEELYPIEAALDSYGGKGWVAAQAGKQTIRILFDEPQAIKQINLKFSETEQERTQEFLLSWLPVGDQTYKEIVRQQYTFSPPSCMNEEENYTVELYSVSAIQLSITPDINSSNAYASLAQLQLG